jgi:Fungal specific transcription factor domain
MLETVGRDGPHAITLTEQAFLFMIFTLGALIKNDGRAEGFYKQASSVAFEVIAETTTESATLTFLMALYQQTTGRISAAWTTIGVVVRIAQALGCMSVYDEVNIDHRNVSHWGLSSFHQEFRRRIWSNIYILDAYQSVVYGRPPIIQDAECDVEPLSAAIDDDEMSPGKPVPAVSDGKPKQMDFHLAFYKLCRLKHRMMKRLYLNVEQKFDTWETIRSITESLQEFRVSLPKHLRFENLEDQDDVIQRQTIVLDMFISHTLNICCRPLLVHRQADSVSPAVAQHRRNYCQDVAVMTSNHLADIMDYRHRCGFLARMLFSASGIYLTAAEVLALHAIAAPKGSPGAIEAWKNLNKILSLFVYSDRAGPFTAQMMSILQDLIRLVVRINEERSSKGYQAKSIPPSPYPTEAEVATVPAIDDNLFPTELLNDFLNQDPFPNLAMDDMIWMPEKSMSSVWGDIGEWKDII